MSPVTQWFAGLPEINEVRGSNPHLEFFKLLSLGLAVTGSDDQLGLIPPGVSKSAPDCLDDIDIRTWLVLGRVTDSRRCVVASSASNDVSSSGVGRVRPIRTLVVFGRTGTTTSEGSGSIRAAEKSNWRLRQQHLVISGSGIQNLARK